MTLWTPALQGRTGFLLPVDRMHIKWVTAADEFAAPIFYVPQCSCSLTCDLAILPTEEKQCASPFLSFELDQCFALANFWERQDPTPGEAQVLDSALWPSSSSEGQDAVLASGAPRTLIWPPDAWAGANVRVQPASEPHGVVADEATECLRMLITKMSITWCLQLWVPDTVAKHQTILLEMKTKPARRCSQESHTVYLCQFNYKNL